ncbi:MAG: S-layer family protein [Actinobacteria bacterium]|nr:S-layer family protein [Actinomycetota bacterium]
MKTGDADATGNAATNNTQQTVVQGHNGAVVIVDQNATITNTGIGISNTGGNVAIGNVSDNTASNSQKATSTGASGDSVASNNATTRNTSGGDARIDTGDASATGSTSNNAIHQTFDGNYDGGLGVVVLVDQNATITNTGVGIANTGLNGAVGNDSLNGASNDQTANATAGPGDSVAANDATASTNSGGSAGIITGDANAVGNAATNNVSQVVNVTATGSLGSIVLIDQNANVSNVGISIANTGLNLAVGNLSDSTTNNIQGATSGAGPPAGDDSVASNDGTATAESNGDASITTGNANAVGNSSTTNLTQVVDVNTPGSGLVLTDQTATVNNTGVAIANTGGNIAEGNTSFNDASSNQRARSNSTGDDSVAANFGSAVTNSDGSASIDSGNASAIGNASTTNVIQTVNATTNGGFALPDQDVTVNNTGVGIANTGLNTATGNDSVNSSTTSQDARVAAAGDDAVASNFGDATTTSNGSADVTTGNANAVGNDSAATTNVAQTVDTDGVNNVLSDQSVTATDNGVALANTGLNGATGNTSDNTASTRQSADIGAVTGDDTVASNFGESDTNSDGSASITTGNADAVGSSAHTNVAQTVDTGSAGGFVLTDQDVDSSNTGVGIANSGLNTATGNDSANTSTTRQRARINADVSDDAVAANFGSSSSTSDGSADIHTGNASGVGTRSTTNVAQTVDTNGAGFVLPDQSATVTNTGVGISNTGLNTATGNESDNDSTVNQRASVAQNGNGGIDGRAVASNDGTSSTSSNGSAEIRTGDATAIGNDAASTVNIAQTVNTDGAGFTLVDQEANASNTGVGIANSGLNTAVGNDSSNSSDVDQDASVTQNGGGRNGGIDGDVVASNNATSDTNSNGSAKIVTGCACAIGNASTTNISQVADFDGDGFALVDQSLSSTNTGVAVANSGLNTATGNSSDNDSTVDQDSAVTANGGSILGDAVAVNTATSSSTTDGSASITTGDAIATGNISTSHLNQVSDASIDGSGFVLTDQEAVEVNNGVGIANSGLNSATGNDSTNSTDLDQDAAVSENGGGNIGALLAPSDVVSANTSASNTSSNGSASITTGHACATGNQSTTTLNQVSDANISGSGFLLADQDADVSNTGVGIANSGINFATGNDADTSNTLDQDSAVTEGGAGDLLADDVVAANTATNSSNSDGDASITTGDALAIGNDSAHTTVLNQVVDANIDGSGFVLSDQDAEVDNTGVGIANSGVNFAVGNTSTNTIDDPSQTATVAQGGGGAFTADDVVAANTVNAANNSDGSASIHTGAAIGTGNTSTTTLNQIADANISGAGFVLTDQAAEVNNTGVGIGNSGFNGAIGNDSDNTVEDGTQDATVDANGAVAIDDAVAANTATLQNNSNGSASITTGFAGGSGNTSTTDLSQVADSNVVSGFVLSDQDVEVNNQGVGIGNSGLNLAVGNLSTNSIDFDDTATVDAAGALTADDAVASNTLTGGNNSDGSASINTGASAGFGNTSITYIIQNGDDNDATVTNSGVGIANSGLNLGTGNASDNDIDTTDTATVDAAGIVDDFVAVNTLTENNNSDGTVDITTGDAYALGNRSATGIVQSASASDDNFGLDDSNAVIINFGVGLANTGLNLAAGNTSDNDTTNTSTATAPGGIAVNTADLSNTSDGTATVRTGNAIAFGNIASNAICQGVDSFGPGCPQPTLPPLPVPSFPTITCRCKKALTPPIVVVPPGTPTPPVVPSGNPIISHPDFISDGSVLARTGVSVGMQALLGLLLLALGALFKRRARTA